MIRSKPALLLLIFAVLATPLGAAEALADQERWRTLKSRIEEEWPLRTRNEPVSRYVQCVGERLARSSARGRNLPWHFAVVRDRSGNAYNIGGGNIYVTEGVLLESRNESEVAAVLAHEMGHEIAGHFAGNRSNPSHERMDLLPWRDLDSQKSEVGIGSLTQVVDPALEMEADGIAVEFLSAAGYSPHAMLEVAERLTKGARDRGSKMRIETLKRRLLGFARREPPDSSTYREVKVALERETAARIPP